MCTHIKMQVKVLINGNEPFIKHFREISFVELELNGRSLSILKALFL